MISRLNSLNFYFQGYLKFAVYGRSIQDFNFKEFQGIVVDYVITTSTIRRSRACVEIQNRHLKQFL